MVRLAEHQTYSRISPFPSALEGRQVHFAEETFHFNEMKLNEKQPWKLSPKCQNCKHYTLQCCTVKVASCAPVFGRIMDAMSVGLNQLFFTVPFRFLLPFANRLLVCVSMSHVLTTAMPLHPLLLILYKFPLYVFSDWLKESAKNNFKKVTKCFAVRVKRMRRSSANPDFFLPSTHFALAPSTLLNLPCTPDGCWLSGWVPRISIMITLS